MAATAVNGIVLVPVLNGLGQLTDALRMSPEAAIALAMELLEVADQARAQREVAEGKVPEPRSEAEITEEKRRANRLAQQKRRKRIKENQS